MTIYHMETDTLRGVASQFQSAAEEMQSRLQSLASLAQSIDWIGENRNQFEAEIRSWSSAIQDQIESGRTLAQRINQEVQEWEEVCARMGSGYSSVTGNLPLVGAIAIPGIAGAVTAAQGQVLGVSTAVGASNIPAWRLGSGSFQEQVRNRVDAELAGQLDPLNANLLHYQKSKASLETLRASDEAFLQELDAKVNDLHNHDNPLDWADDKLNDLLGTTKTYEQVRQETIDRLARTNASIADLDSKIATTQGQIDSIKTAAYDKALQAPNTTYPIPPSNPSPVPQKGYCMKYVSDFRGQPPTQGGIERSASASDLVTSSKYAGLRYNVSSTTPDIRDQVVPGTIVAYDKGQLHADATYGHAAVVTEVGKDYVVVTESSWGSGIGQPRRIPLSDLSQLTFNWL